MMMKQIPTHDLSRIGLDIVNDIFASEVKTQYGDSLRIRKNSSFSYDIPTTLWKDLCLVMVETYITYTQRIRT